MLVRLGNFELLVQPWRMMRPSDLHSWSLGPGDAPSAPKALPPDAIPAPSTRASKSSTFNHAVDPLDGRLRSVLRLLAASSGLNTKGSQHVPASLGKGRLGACQRAEDSFMMMRDPAHLPSSPSSQFNSRPVAAPAASRTEHAPYGRSGVFRRTYLVCDNEPRFEQPAVEVGGHGAIPATLPETVLALETLFPHGFDGFVVGLEELE